MKLSSFPRTRLAGTVVAGLLIVQVARSGDSPSRPSAADVVTQAAEPTLAGPALPNLTAPEKTARADANFAVPRAMSKRLLVAQSTKRSPMSTNSTRLPSELVAVAPPQLWMNSLRRQLRPGERAVDLGLLGLGRREQGLPVGQWGLA